MTYASLLLGIDYGFELAGLRTIAGFEEDRVAGYSGSWLSRGYAAFVVHLRWLVLVGVGAAVLAATIYLPTLRSDVGLQISDGDSGTEQSVRKALEEFGVPLLSRIAIVQRDPDGLQPVAVETTFRHAAKVNLDTVNNGMPAARNSRCPAGTKLVGARRQAHNNHYLPLGWLDTEQRRTR